MEGTNNRIRGARNRCPKYDKKQYETEAEAHREAKIFRKKFGPRLRPYQCVYCHYWHNGHDRPPHRRRPREEFTDPDA